VHEENLNGIKEYQAISIIQTNMMYFDICLRLNCVDMIAFDVLISRRS